MTWCLPLVTTRLMDYPKTLIVLYFKLSHKFICFIESCESRRGILLGTTSTFSFGRTYGDGYCSFADSYNMCTVTEFILVVTLCEGNLMFFFISKTFLEEKRTFMWSQDFSHTVLLAPLSRLAAFLDSTTSEGSFDGWW